MHTVWSYLYEGQEKAKLISKDGKQISGCLGPGWWWDCTKGHRKHFGMMEMLHVDYHGGFMGVYICQNSSNFTLEIGAVYCT